MIQEVKFQGLSHSPSDHESADGELGTCLNLINEDGALHTIAQPQVTDSGISLPDGASIVFVHKVTHSNTIHSHYIVRRSDGTYYWLEKGGNGTATDISLGGFSVNAVTAVGNILCFVGNESIMYAFWNKEVYNVFNKNAFNYTFCIANTGSGTVDVVSELGDEFQNCFFTESWGSNDFDALEFIQTKISGTRTIWNSIDAMINKKKSDYGEYYFKYVAFGVVALRLYDGSYCNISNIFVLSPTESINDSIYYNADSETIKNTEYQKFVSASCSVHKHQINVQLNLDGIEDFVQGVDVFLTKETDFLDVDKSYETIADRANVFEKNRKGTIVIDHLKKSSLYKEFDKLVFYHSLYIDKANFGEDIDLQSVQGTEEALSLADMGRTFLGGSCAMTYNSRLHLANINNYVNSIFSPNPTYKFGLTSEFGALSKNKSSTIFGNYMDVPLTNDGLYNLEKQNSDTAELVAVIDNENYYRATVQYPVNPILTIPYSDAKNVKLYIKHKTSLMDEIGFKNISLHPSETFGISYFILNDEDGLFSFMQTRNVNLIDNYLKRVPGTTFTSTSSKYYDDAYQRCDTFGGKRNSSPSLVKVSEAENPLVFPAANSVQVGSSIISALAANTRPISEGQFGAAPLYAFTDEGVWVLMTSTTGTYDARQPTSRDICSNPSGILQIDDAILYPTERGIMMQQGREAKCITEALDGYPFDFTRLYKEEYAKKMLAIEGVGEDAVKYARFRDYLQSADMIYDYYDSRIIVFNPSYAYAYVYSIRSGMWGTMTNVFNKRVNIYPEAYATNKDGRIIDAYVRNPTDDVTYFLCSRPLSLSGGNIYKTMFSSIARGYFREAAKGKCALVLYGSNDLFHWFPIKTSVHKYLRGMAGSPYKHFRIALTGKLSPDETISSLSTEFQERWQNKLR